MKIKHAMSERGDDFYATPVEAVNALINIERLPQTIWEPACGDGAIVNPLRGVGYNVLCSDIVDRGLPGAAIFDFLGPQCLMGATGIVTNPPFNLALKFVDKALRYADYTAMLLRLSFLEGIERNKWYKESAPSRIHISSRRLPRMHRAGWEGKQNSSTVCYAWFVWDHREKEISSDPIVKWFDWKDYA